jgi:CubicO group peptidase (beta-lactamase class C family)
LLKFGTSVGILSVVASLAFAPAAHAQQQPPVAAPTKGVSVDALPLVRPEGQALGDFLSGLAAGLMQDHRVPGMTIVVVKNGDVLLDKGFGVEGGAAVDPLTTKFRVGTLSGLVTAIAVMQLIERADILLNEDAGAALGEKDRGITIADLLLGRGDSGLLATIVQKVSGEPLEAYVRDHVLAPLGMAHSDFDQNGLAISSGDMGRFLLALLNNGTYENTRVLLPETVALMERTQFTFHLALAGWTYGFAEIHRNDWHGLQRDGVAQANEARLVLVPEEKAAYFIAVNAHAGAKFWRALDDALFDRLFSPRDDRAPALDGAAPALADTRAASGTYQLHSLSGYDVLRAGATLLRVNAQPDGALVLKGAEDAVLLPHAGGYWRSNAGNIHAAVKDGKLVLDTRVYDSVPFWQRIPLWVLVGAAFVVLAALAFGAYRIMKS